MLPPVARRRHRPAQVPLTVKPISVAEHHGVYSAATRASFPADAVVGGREWGNFGWFDGDELIGVGLVLSPGTEDEELPALPEVQFCPGIINSARLSCCLRCLRT